MIVYADEVPEDRPACENQMPVGTVALATGRLVPRRGTRELSVRLQTDMARRGATGEWVNLDAYRRSFTFEHGCPIRSSRSKIEVRGGQVWDTRWSPNGTALHVLVGRGPGTRVLTYRRPWAGPRQRPRVAGPTDVVLELGPAAPGGRWVAIRGEGRLDGRNAGLLDLRSGDVHWLDDPGRIQGFTQTPDLPVSR